METLLIVGLLLTTILFAVQAERWRRNLKASEHDNMQLSCDLSRSVMAERANAFTSGLKQGTGGMYRSAMMAGATDDVLAALRRTGRRLLNEPNAFTEEEPIVQVPNLVSHESANL